MTDPGFAAHLPDFLAYQQTPWGRLRYRVVAANLARHLTGPATVLDAGGGNGMDAITLAQLGHRVTVLDNSAALLEQAGALAKQRGVHVRTHHADVTEPPAGEFDLVLCHNVLHYTDDRHAVVRALVGALAPGGLISVLCPNAHSDPLRTAVRDLDPVRALAELDAESSYVETIGRALPACTAAGESERLAAAGITVLGHYGVRCAFDYVPDETKQDPDFLAALEKLELAMAGRMPYPLTARFFQLIGRRGDPLSC